MKRSRIDNFIMAQEGLQRLTRREIEAVQLTKLNRVLALEKQRGGFYRGLPECLDSLDELRTLPFTTDEDLAQNAPGLLLRSQAEISRVLSDATSGTTGAAKRVFYTEGDCRNTVLLFKAGLGELVFPGSVTMICFPFSGPHGLGELISEAIEGLGARPLKLGAALSYGELKSVMEREQPDTFVGMPVQLLSLLRVCGKGSLKRALVSGDGCPEIVIRSCEELLGTRLFPHYGSREMALGGAIACPAHEGMHLRENHVIAEIIGPDGETLPWGESGELVITTIGMEALPLIRYRTGDLTRILLPPCPCGSEVLRLDTVRRADTEEMLRLEEWMFRQPDVADYRAERRDGKLCLTVMTVGDAPVTAPEGAALIRRPVTKDDGPLYHGKRKIMEWQP
ncbi:MAG: AMP-binding protein [Oscillospiraceae bacterium]|nr:AMP-binding protein [Oscillospiraceae bacterium]